jgi:hypothetical protein
MKETGGLGQPTYTQNFIQDHGLIVKRLGAR